MMFGIKSLLVGPGKTLFKFTSYDSYNHNTDLHDNLTIHKESSEDNELVLSCMECPKTAILMWEINQDILRSRIIITITGAGRTVSLFFPKVTSLFNLFFFHLFIFLLT